jgi:hypothetical protein
MPNLRQDIRESPRASKKRCQPTPISLGALTPSHHLDTLETTVTPPLSKAQESHAKRTFQKTSTTKNSLALVDLNSPLQKGYWDTWHCCRVMLQDGNKFTGSLCHKRWCSICNDIKTANLINGYKHLLDDFQSPQFVVLTMPNCEGRELKSYYDRMTIALRKARRVIKRRDGIVVDGIRTFECTYNPKTNHYHPHYNVLVDGKEVAESIQAEWLAYWTNAKPAAQSIQAITSTKGLLEAFKYVTKMSVSTKEQTHAQDWIYQCVKGKRLAQTFGSLRKAQIEPSEGLVEVFEDITPQTEIWVYCAPSKLYLNAQDNPLVSQAIVDRYKATRKGRKRCKRMHPQIKIHPRPTTQTTDVRSGGSPSHYLALA